jgi:hypothetical protein
MAFWQKWTNAVLITFFALSNSNVQAGFIVSIDLDPALGIQATNALPAHVNDRITASILLEMTSPSTVSVYSFSIRLGNGLSYFGRTELGFGTLIGDRDPNNLLVGGDTASRFDAGLIGGSGYGIPTGPVSVGTITFDVVGTSNLTIQPGLFDGGNFDLFVDGLGNEVLSDQFTFNSGTVNITAVPEPSSFVLMATLSFGVITRRVTRRKRGE